VSQVGTFLYADIHFMVGYPAHFYLLSWNPQMFVVNSRFAFESLERLYQIIYSSELARRAWANVFSVSSIRALLSSITLSLPDWYTPFTNFLKQQWKIKTGKVWSDN
jgi:hypothetical protein